MMKVNYSELSKGDCVYLNPTHICLEKHIGIFYSIVTSDTLLVENESCSFVCYQVPQMIEIDENFTPHIEMKVSKLCHSSLHLVPLTYFVKKFRNIANKQNPSSMFVM